MSRASVIEVSRPEILPVLHNVSSPQRVVELAKAAYGLGFPAFVVTKPTGAAAQVGIPEAQKVALREGKSLLILPDLSDAIEILKADAVLIVLQRKFSEQPLTGRLKELISRGANRILLVFGGSEPGISAREASLGDQVYVDEIDGDVGPTALAVIAMYLTRNLLGR